MEWDFKTIIEKARRHCLRYNGDPYFADEFSGWLCEYILKNNVDLKVIGPRFIGYRYIDFVRYNFGQTRSKKERTKPIPFSSCNESVMREVELVEAPFSLYTDQNLSELNTMLNGDRFNKLEKRIIKYLIYDGFSSLTISKKLKLSQSSISLKLKKIMEKLNDDV